jgi:hypothetical protein
MNFYEAIAEMMLEGRLIKRSCWNRWMSKATTDINLLMYDVLADDWEVMERPKKTKLMALALINVCGSIGVSSTLYSSEEKAREELHYMVVAWPAIV